MTVPDQDGCDQLVNDGGDAALLIHKGKLHPPALERNSIPADKTKYTRIAAKCKGVSEETTTGVM